MDRAATSRLLTPASALVGPSIRRRHTKTSSRQGQELLVGSSSTRPSGTGISLPRCGLVSLRRNHHGPHNWKPLSSFLWRPVGINGGPRQILPLHRECRVRLSLYSVQQTVLGTAPRTAGWLVLALPRCLRPVSTPRQAIPTLVSLSHHGYNDDQRLYPTALPRRPSAVGFPEPLAQHLTTPALELQQEISLLEDGPAHGLRVRPRYPLLVGQAPCSSSHSLSSIPTERFGRLPRRGSPSHARLQDLGPGLPAQLPAGPAVVPAPGETAAREEV